MIFRSVYSSRCLPRDCVHLRDLRQALSSAGRPTSRTLPNDDISSLAEETQKNEQGKD